MKKNELNETFIIIIIIIIIIFSKSFGSDYRRPCNRGSIADRGERFPSSPQPSFWLWGPPTLTHWYQGRPEREADHLGGEMAQFFRCSE
jgi:hypothetical protein